MTKKARMLHGEWPRWSKYQFAEGRISPAPGARLERYDPWGEYEAGKERGEPPPYVELLNILRDFRPHARQEYGSGEMGRILEWTRRHGLLGVLHKHLFAQTDDIDSSLYHQFILVGPRLVECDRRYDRGVRIRSYEGWAVNYDPKDVGSTPRGAYAIESDHSESISYITDRFLLPLPDDLYEDAMQRLPPSSSAVVDHLRVASRRARAHVCPGSDYWLPRGAVCWVWVRRGHHGIPGPLLFPQMWR